MRFLLNWSHCVKSYGHFCQISALLMIPAHQTWSCHLTQDENFQNLLFCLNSTFNIRKSQKIPSGKEVISKNLTGRGVENSPPVPLGLNVHTFLTLTGI